MDTYKLVSLGRSSEEDIILNEELWGTLDIHKKGTVITKDLGVCIITFTNNKNIIESIMQDFKFTFDDFEEYYISYGNYLYTPKDNIKKDFEKNVEIIIKNIRQSPFWLDIIGFQFTANQAFQG